MNYLSKKSSVQHHQVIGGSVKVLVYVLAAAFNRCRLDLLAAETVDQVNCLSLRPHDLAGDASTARDEGRAPRSSSYVRS